jgi:hypothetical protein
MKKLLTIAILATIIISCSKDNTYDVKFEVRAHRQGFSDSIPKIQVVYLFEDREDYDLEVSLNIPMGTFVHGCYMAVLDTAGSGNIDTLKYSLLYRKLEDSLKSIVIPDVKAGKYFCIVQTVFHNGSIVEGDFFGYRRFTLKPTSKKTQRFVFTDDDPLMQFVEK